MCILIALDYDGVQISYHYVCSIKTCLFKFILSSFTFVTHVTDMRNDDVMPIKNCIKIPFVLLLETSHLAKSPSL